MLHEVHVFNCGSNKTNNKEKEKPSSSLVSSGVGNSGKTHEGQAAKTVLIY
jgi:hypothetical protein